jgi:hypothetical protein
MKTMTIGQEKFWRVSFNFIFSSQQFLTNYHVSLISLVVATKPCIINAFDPFINNRKGSGQHN